MTRPCVYRFFAADGTLLYIGCTVRGDQRIDKHRYSTPWFEQAANITLEHFGSWLAASHAEAAAIITESPKYNVQQSTHSFAARQAIRELRGLAPLDPTTDPQYDAEEVAS